MKKSPRLLFFVSLLACSLTPHPSLSQLPTLEPDETSRMMGMWPLTNTWTLCWQRVDGTAGLWLMRGTNHYAGGPAGSVGAGSGWHLSGIGNFGGPSGQDLLWERTNGCVGVWFMQGTNHIGNSYLHPSQVDPAWHIAGTGAFGGPTHGDVLWQ